MNTELFSEFGQNAGYVRELYRLFQTDPALVEDGWASYFSSVDANGSDATAPEQVVHTNGTTTPTASPQATGSLDVQQKATLITNAYRTRGHTRARINPLEKAVSPLRTAEDLDLSRYQLSETDLATDVLTNGFAGTTTMRLGALCERLQETYCGTIGFEYEHLTSAEERQWLRQRIEARRSAGYGYPAQLRQRMLEKLIEAEALESELHKKYVGAKRFSIQGGETLIPMIDRLIERAPSEGVRDIVIGMAHRGRLGVLTLNCQKPIAELFAEFEDRTTTTMIGQGDVKYHLGHRGTVQTSGGDDVGIQLLPNPSHLEAINPVVAGVCRARQDRAFGGNRKAVLPVLVHGDAAAVGQGIVPESINMSLLKGYTTGGTVHIVVNNQVGFTTNPDEGRSGNYCTEWAKGAEAPIFHVNGDDIEGSAWVTELAFEFRNVFGRDVMIDLVCWRKYGHNETDDPSFTQPLLYNEIKDLSPLYLGHAEQLSSAGVVAPDFAEQVLARFRERFNQAHEDAQRLTVGTACPLYGKLGAEPAAPPAVSAARLSAVAETLVTFPNGFTPHPKLKQIHQKRVDTLKEGKGIEWGLAETLAFGSILQDGINIRITGQDAGRATFSHRHLQMRDYEKREIYLPLNELSPESGVSKAGYFEVHNSPLSEEAVMGFEFGFGHECQNSLVLWEAQFGDFANGAQIQIDQFISSSESKWNQRSGIVLLLPHGQEGQGPEHSSARLERYLQLCASGNMMVTYPSNAAQYFHLLRRQAHLPVKRPLVVMTPKSLLRAPAAMATRDELLKGSWQPILVTECGKAKKGEKDPVVLCAGKIFYELEAAINKAGVRAKLVRIEQLHPFPTKELESVLKGSNPEKIFWVQEEPQNMGAWLYVWSNIAPLQSNPQFIGRPAAPSPATGSGKFFNAEQAAIAKDTVAALA